MTPYDIHLLRHGAPEIPGLMLGHHDMPATPAGLRACVAQAEQIAPDRIVSSDLSRAQTAATMISTNRSLPHRVDSDWRELDFGDWDGRHPDAIDLHALQRFWADPDGHPPPNGESWSCFTARIDAAITRVEPLGSTLVITHGGAMRAALAVLLRFDQAAIWAFDLPYCALLSLRIWPSVERSAQIIGLRA